MLITGGFKDLIYLGIRGGFLLYFATAHSAYLSYKSIYLEHYGHCDQVHVTPDNSRIRAYA